MVALLPPKIIADIGTPLGLSHRESTDGQLEIGTQNREFGWATGLPDDGSCFSPSQLITPSGL